MSADIVQFIPRANMQADRAFWIGRQQRRMEMMATEIANVALADRDHSDTAPSEYVAPGNDVA